ncbi:glycosyltransferase family 2 protein [Teredinibacter turnerae]|uniref:glycosyltransferase family 2 protein n=1 Tax=Teredinibacter turnerae TaxID=2426 RepID=UPI0004153D9B|nr:glycosyltransferase family 2 protein [Teredinibacter turnerae]
MDVSIEEKIASFPVSELAFDSLAHGFSGFGEKGTYEEFDLKSISCEQGGLIFLITLYNESGGALAATLAALSDSIAHLYTKNGEEYSENITICIIVDGFKEMSSSAQIFFESQGIEFPLPVLDKDDIYFYNAHKGLHRLNAVNEIPVASTWLDLYNFSVKCSGDCQDKLQTQCGDISVQFLVCFKSKNAGKLDSHKLFYQKICEYIAPSYCFQIDAGTCPAKEAVYNVWYAFQRQQNMGAASTSLYTHPPKNYFNLLSIWQFNDFAKKSLAGIWGESASGYISVVPGQFSAIRWAALASDPKLPPQIGPQPLDVYLKGLQPLDPFESAIYQTEDRILCKEIVNRPKFGWKIRHVESAIAVTDSCNSWSELLKQRKRWNSGALFSKISFASGLKRYVKGENSTFQKLDRAMSSTLHTFWGIFEWLLLGIFLYSIVALTGLAFNRGTVDQYSNIATFSAIALVVIPLMVQITIFANDIKSDLSQKIVYFSVIVQVLVTFVIGMAAVWMNPDLLRLILIVMAIFIGTIALSSIKNRQSSNVVIPFAKSSIQYSLINPVVSLILWAYAVTNIHDNSWGTKGLDSPDYKSSMQSQYKKFRRYYVLLWLSSNIAVAVALYGIFANNHLLGITVLLTLSIIENVIAMLAISTRYIRNIYQKI